MTTAPFPLEGGCTCGHVRYSMTTAPLVVHACHCRWCQRLSGGTHALNALIETDRVTLLTGEPESILTPSASGRGQQIARCPHCRVAVWSHYAGFGPPITFVRVGTLDAPDHLPPDIHIFTSSKQPWLSLPQDALVVPEYYDWKTVWSDDARQRFQTLLPQVKAWHASGQSWQ